MSVSSALNAIFDGWSQPSIRLRICKQVALSGVLISTVSTPSQIVRLHDWISHDFFGTSSAGVRIASAKKLNASSRFKAFTV